MPSGEVFGAKMEANGVAGCQETIWEAFGVVPYANPTNKCLPTNSLVRQRESRRAREYLAAYRRGCTVHEVDQVSTLIKINK